MGCKSIPYLLGRMHVYEADFLKAVRYALAKVCAFPSPKSIIMAPRNIESELGRSGCSGTPYRNTCRAMPDAARYHYSHSHLESYGRSAFALWWTPIHPFGYKVPPEWTKRLGCQSQAVFSGIAQSIRRWSRNLCFGREIQGAKGPCRSIRRSTLFYCRFNFIRD